MHVQGVVQRADGDLALGDAGEIGDAAVALEVQQRSQVAGLQVELGQAHGALGVVAGSGQRDVQGDGRAADAALGPGDRDDPAADVLGHTREVVGLGALAHRLRPRRPARGGVGERLDRHRRREHVAEAGAHGLAQQVGCRLARGEQQQPDGRVLGLKLARELEDRQGTQLLVEHEDLDLGVGEHRDHVVARLRRGDDLDLGGLLGQRDDLGRAIGIGEAEREPCLHRVSSGVRARVGGSVYSRLEVGSLRDSSPRRISERRISDAKVSA